WIARVYVDHRDHLRVAKPQVRPCLAAVGGLVDAVARREVGADDARARPHVDDVRVRGRDRNGADRPGRLIVEDGGPRRAVVSRAPDAAVIEAGVKHVWLAWYARERAGAARPDGAD